VLGMKKGLERRRKIRWNRGLWIWMDGRFLWISLGYLARRNYSVVSMYSISVTMCGQRLCNANGGQTMDRSYIQGPCAKFILY